MPNFLLLALFAGCGLAIISGPLGAFVLWRRMAYFGDTLAHSALLGVALGLFLQVDLWWAVLATSSALALLLVRLGHNKTLANDTLLGILSHSALAAGLVCISQFSGQRVDIHSLLFGDLLTASLQDVLVLYGFGAVVLAVLVWAWRPLVLCALDEALAQAEGIAVQRWQTLLMVLLAVVIALAMKVVGVLLITALLIIPAASARQLARSPEALAVLASLLAVAAVVAGLAASWWWDTPAGPSIVLASALGFGLVLGLGRVRTNRLFKPRNLS